MQWLNTMRLGDGGFISTVDTIVAMEALVTYSYNSRIKDITDLTVEVDIPDSNLTHSFHITGQNIAKLQRIDIPNVWGHINLVANGAGQAIAQLDVNWGVDYEPFKVRGDQYCIEPFLKVGTTLLSKKVVKGCMSTSEICIPSVTMF